LQRLFVEKDQKDLLIGINKVVGVLGMILATESTRRPTRRMARFRGGEER